MTAAVVTVALPATALAIVLLLRSPLSRRLVSAPRDDRWHERNTPSLGGIAIFAGILAGVGVTIAAGGVHGSRELLGIVGGCAIVFGAGLVDDLRSLAPVAKIGSQLAAAALVLSTGLSVQIVGSDVLAVGIALGSLGLAASWKAAGTTVATLLLPILVLAIPILDTTLVTIVRIVEGRPISRGGRDHTSHRLVYRGLSERRAVVLLAVVAAGIGAASLASNIVDDPRLAIPGRLLTFALLLQFASFISHVEPPRGALPTPPRPTRP